jgi:DtxR family manganese transport transcriptional regulator
MAATVKKVAKRKAKSTRPTADRPNKFERIRSDHATERAQDYLELIDDLITEHGEARAVDVAHRLGVSHVTVTKAVARLQVAGLVTSEPYRAIYLTPEGKQIADEARKRHQVVVGFLLAIGVPPDDAEIDAEGIEHHISPATLSAMKRFLSSKGSA